MILQPHQQRVVDEKEDLDGKLTRLRFFIDGSALFATLPADEQTRLKEQAQYMAGYSDVLKRRIAAFE